VHYSADPDKNATTPRGKEWLVAASEGYPGGMGSQKWRQEMEIDWEAAGGELVFPFLELYESKVVCRPFEVPESWALYASFDYGHRNPSAFVVMAIDHDGNVCTVWEYYRAGAGYEETARAIRECPYFDRLAFAPIADPSIWALNQQAGNNEVKSIAQLFSELPPELAIYFAKGKKGGDITAAEKILGLLWKDIENREARWKIFSTCQATIWELKRLRYADWGGALAAYRNKQESIVDKDNHSWDAHKMFFNLFFSSPVMPAKPEMEKLKREDPLSYREWEFMQKRREDRGLSDIGQLITE
jgi:hypothetical protein